MPPFVNFYPKGGNRPKRVENPDNVKGKKDKERRIQRKFNASY